MTGHLVNWSFSELFHSFFFAPPTPPPTPPPKSEKKSCKSTDKKILALCISAEEFGDESVDQDGRQPLYPGHIPTSVFQKALLTAGSTFMSLFDPTRGRK